MAKKRKPPQPVHIGHTSAREHWDRYVSPAYNLFRERPTIENANKCAEAIWELRDWRWRNTHPGIDPRDAPKAFDDQLFSACPGLDLIRDIAESKKHGGQLGRGSVKVKRATHAASNPPTDF